MSMTDDQARDHGPDAGGAQPDARADDALADHGGVEPARQDGRGVLSGMGYMHKTVNHSIKEYVSTRGATVNAIENFWRHLKCSILGTHVSVSRKHMSRYVKEFEFRFNRRDDAASMFPALITTFRSSGR